MSIHSVFKSEILALSQGSFKIHHFIQKKVSWSFLKFKTRSGVLSLIAQTKISSPRFPILLLHSSHLSCTRRKPSLVWGRVHPAVCGERPKIHDFSKISGDVPFCKIISQDLLGRFGREYACWKDHIVYFYLLGKNIKIWIYRLLPILGRG